MHMVGLGQSAKVVDNKNRDASYLRSTCFSTKNPNNKDKNNEIFIWVIHTDLVLDMWMVLI